MLYPRCCCAAVGVACHELGRLHQPPWNGLHDHRPAGNCRYPCCKNPYERNCKPVPRGRCWELQPCAGPRCLPRPGLFPVQHGLFLLFTSLSPSSVRALSAAFVYLLRFRSLPAHPCASLLPLPPLPRTLSLTRTIALSVVMVELPVCLAKVTETGHAIPLNACCPRMQQSEWETEFISCFCTIRLWAALSCKQSALRSACAAPSPRGDFSAPPPHGKLLCSSANLPPRCQQSAPHASPTSPWQRRCDYRYPPEKLPPCK